MEFYQGKWGLNGFSWEFNGISWDGIGFNDFMGISHGWKYWSCLAHTSDVICLL